jgi:hypothetical protein
MSETLKIIEDFLKGNNDAGGTIADLEDEILKMTKEILELQHEVENWKLHSKANLILADYEHDRALEWAAWYINDVQLIGKSDDVKEYARTMGMSLLAAKRGLTKRAADGRESSANFPASFLG